MNNYIKRQMCSKIPDLGTAEGEELKADHRPLSVNTFGFRANDVKQEQTECCETVSTAKQHNQLTQPPDNTPLSAVQDETNHMK